MIPDDTDLLPRLRRLHLLADRLHCSPRDAAAHARHQARHCVLSAPPCSTRWGGTELIGARDYAPGDDPRHIDWHLCARRDELQTRLFGGGLPGRLDLLIDVSASMGRLTPRTPRQGRMGGAGADTSPSDRADGGKLGLARRIAAMAAAVALERGEAVAVTPVGADVGPGLPARRGRGQTARVIRFLRALPRAEGHTDLHRVAQRFVRLRRGPGRVILISDLYDVGGYRTAIDVLRHRGHSAAVVQLFEPWEAAPNPLGDVELFDVESRTGRRVRLTAALAAAYRRRFEQFLTEVRTFCAQRTVPLLQLPSDLSDNEVSRQLLGLAAPKPGSK